MVRHGGDIVRERLQLWRHGLMIEVPIVALDPALRDLQHHFEADGRCPIEKRTLRVQGIVLKIVEHRLVDAMRCQTAQCQVS